MLIVSTDVECDEPDCLQWVNGISGHTTVQSKIARATVARMGWKALTIRKPGVGVPDRPVTEQLPFGDFAPGRYAWLLTDITPCNPQPAKGRQGLWDWEAS